MKGGKCKKESPGTSVAKKEELFDEQRCGSGEGEFKSPRGRNAARALQGRGYCREKVTSSDPRGEKRLRCERSHRSARLKKGGGGGDRIKAKKRPAGRKGGGGLIVRFESAGRISRNQKGASLFGSRQQKRQSLLSRPDSSFTSLSTQEKKKKKKKVQSLRGGALSNKGTAVRCSKEEENF